LTGWDPALTDALAASREIVLVDAPGVDASTGSPKHTVAETAQAIIAFLDALRLREIDLLGFSRAVDELPQPRDRGLRVAVLAVVEAQPAATAVFAGLRDVRAQFVDEEPHAAGGDAGDPLPGLGVRGLVVVGAQQRVHELGRARDYADTVVGRLRGAGGDGFLRLAGGWRGRHSSARDACFGSEEQ
jgi:pimeloyl-ACP methyl ester carboxylesterase